MRLIVVDDDRLVVDSLKIILGAQPQIEVVGTGANGNDAVSLYAEHAPDLALLDIQMPERSVFGQLPSQVGDSDLRAVAQAHLCQD